MSVADFLRKIRPFVITPGEWYKECNTLGNRLLHEDFTNGNDGNGKQEWKIIHSIYSLKTKKKL